jgi:hypothetical protein
MSGYYRKVPRWRDMVNAVNDRYGGDGNQLTRMSDMKGDEP